jgi:hypothetical protein
MSAGIPNVTIEHWNPGAKTTDKVWLVRKFPGGSLPIAEMTLKDALLIKKCVQFCQRNMEDLGEIADREAS